MGGEEELFEGVVPNTSGALLLALETAERHGGRWQGVVGDAGATVHGGVGDSEGGGGSGAGDDWAQRRQLLEGVGVLRAIRCVVKHGGQVIERSTNTHLFLIAAAVLA